MAQFSEGQKKFLSCNPGGSMVYKPPCSTVRFLPVPRHRSSTPPPPFAKVLTAPFENMRQAGEVAGDQLGTLVVLAVILPFRIALANFSLALSWWQKSA